MEVTYYGHSCFLLRTGGKSILFDPFITPNPLAADIDAGSIMPDYMLLSHGHSDHVADAVSIARQSNCTVIAIWEIYSWITAQGIENAHPMNIGGSRNFDFGKVRMVNAVHSSSLPDGSYGGNPAGFLISSGGKNIYYSGDTALHADMSLIPTWGKPDIGFICLGDNFTMNVEDAVRCAQMTGCKEVIGMHYDTFGYIVINHEEAINKFREAGITLHLMNIGETRQF